MLEETELIGSSFSVPQHFIPKYSRYEKRHKNLSAHASPAFRIEVGDTVTVGQSTSSHSLRCTRGSNGREVVGATRELTPSLPFFSLRFLASQDSAALSRRPFDSTSCVRSSPSASWASDFVEVAR